MFSIPFNIERSITVDLPRSEVYSLLADFNTWPTWSPWIIQEPTSEVIVTHSPSTIGHQQEWNGKRIGSGKMVLIEATENTLLSYDLFFISPWKSHSKTQFEFLASQDENGNEQTNITWKMQGTLPFFLFFMKKMMSVFVGGDYERGLKMFKEFAETGEVHSAVSIGEVTTEQGFHYLGYRKACHIKEVSNVLGPCFEKLKANDLPAPDHVLTIIDKFNLMTGETEMTAAFGYKNKPNQPYPSELLEGEIPEHTAVSALHTGAYPHLANGWVTLMNYMRFAKLKQNKKIKEYEVYLNNPETTDIAELETKIVIPVKS